MTTRATHAIALWTFLAAACSTPATHDAAMDGSVASDSPAADIAHALDAPTVDTAATDTPAAFDAPTTVDALPPRDSGPTADVPRVDAQPGACPAATLGTTLGRTRLMVGGTMDDAPFAQAPFDIRYLYLAGNVPTGGSCASCLTGCTINGTNCANSGPGCPWWGCWQWDMLPPGQYVSDFVTHTRTAHAVPMFSYYVWFTVAGNVEGATEIAALNDGARTQRYLADWKFVCQRVAAAGTEPVILHVEPDLWGFAEQVNQDPTQIPAAVSAAGLSECAGLPNTVAGFARCMLQIARANAPHALVGFHASAWGAGADAVSTTDATLDVNAHADRTAAFMRALGADRGDLVVVEMSDRDAGFNMRWFDATNATFPNFTRALAWQHRVAQDLGLASLYWQIPYGHTGLPNNCDHYADNRVEYFFAHAGEFAAAGLVGIAFGAGASCMTTPTTDSGFFVAHAMSYFAASATRPCLCGAASCP